MLLNDELFDSLPHLFQLNIINLINLRDYLAKFLRVFQFFKPAFCGLPFALFSLRQSLGNSVC